MVQFFDAGITNDETFGWLEYFLLNHLGGLPAQKTFLFALERGRLRPHPCDVLEAVLQLLEELLLEGSFLSINGTKLLPHLDVCQLCI